MSDQEKFMKRALELAAKGLGRTGTNPVVGAVVVKSGKIIGSGFHKRQGGLHAEAEALKNVATGAAKGATIYVTLEPCVHENKRTPPCTELLKKSGIKEVVISVRDPNPFVNGKGVKALVAAGLKVREGLMKDESERLNEFYFTSVTTSLPFVTLKLAVSVDGKIAACDGSSRWITGSESRRYVHKMRNIHDAVLTTAETVLADDPHLGVRLARGRDPLRIIMDKNGKLDAKMKVFRDKNFLVISGRDLLQSKNTIYGKTSVLKCMFHDLYDSGVGSIMVEAGSVFSAALLKEKIVNKCMFFIAPKIIGGEGLTAVAKLGVKTIGKCLKLRTVKYSVFGEDVLMEGYF